MFITATRTLKSRAVFFILLSLALAAGCGRQTSIPGSAQDYIRLSDTYYQKAIDRYKEAITKSPDAQKLRFELGLLYYSHGELEKAVEEFNKTSEVSAKKFLAIAYYRLGDFTGALEVFNRYGNIDDEYAYYRGLTCEKLNLFDQALSAYRDIRSGEFKVKARLRIESIEKNSGVTHLQDIDPAVKKAVLNAPGQDAYPQAGALILLADENFLVNPDNTGVSQFHYLIKVLNERGKEEFAEAQIEYDSTFEKVELVYARTIKPDGSVVNVGSRHIRDVSKYMNFPLYSNARVFIISFPEVASGACLEYKLSVRRSELINKKDFILGYPLQATEPILSADFTVSLPKDRRLNIKDINKQYSDFGARLDPVISRGDDRLTYSWHFKDIPQIIPEAAMPPNVRINPTILMSTFESWEEVYKWWWGLAKDKIAADAGIKEKVSSLIKSGASDEEKARAIYDFCAQNIRYVAVEYGQAGHEPHKASDIFTNKYGDCKDQAVLLVTMLQEAGLKAHLVLIGTKKYYNLDTELPGVLFNHAIACVELRDKTVFLDPTAQTASFGDLPVEDQGRRVLVFSPQGYTVADTPEYKAEHNLIEQKLEIKVNADETISAKKYNFTRGFYDQAQRYWLLYTQPQLVRDTLASAAQSVSIGAVLDNYAAENVSNLDKPVTLNYSFHGQEYFTPAGKMRILPQLASVDTSLVSRNTRRYPLDLSFLNIKESATEIRIPDGFRLKEMPEGLAQKSPWFKFDIEYSFKNNKITCKEKIQTLKDTVAQEDYPAFKGFIEKTARLAKQRIVLEKTE